MRFNDILKIIVAFILCHIAIFLTLQDSYLLYFIAVLIFTLPIVLFSFAQTTLIKEAKLKHLSSNTFIYKLTSKRHFSFLFHLVAGTAISFVIPVFMTTFCVAEYISCLITLLLIFIARFFIPKISARIYKEKYVEIKNKTATDCIIILFGIIFFPLLIWIFSDFSDSCLHDYKNFRENQIAFVIGSIINNFAQVSNAFLNNDFSQQTAIPFRLILAVLVLQGGILFFSLTRFFLFFFLDSNRIKSVFAPTSELKTKEVFPQYVVIFCISSILIFSVLSFSAYFFCSDTRNAKYIDDKTVLLTEKISDNIYKIGTVNKLEKLEQELAAETKKELTESVNKYFDQITVKVDNYLDWYYSLSHEYSELLTFFAGIATNKLDEKMQDFLGKNLEEKLCLDYELEDELYTKYNNLYQKFNDTKKVILAENIITHKNSFYHIVIRTDSKKIYKMKEPTPLISPDSKAAIAISTGIGSGIAAKIITTKLLKRLSAKISAKNVAATASKKLASVTGAAIGTTVGPIGTIIGAGVGLGVGILTDKLLISVDESFNREKYKADIIAGIEEERQFYLQQIADYKFN